MPSGSGSRGGLATTSYWLLSLSSVFVSRLPASKEQLSLDLALFIFELAVLANIVYCAAYVADIPVQMTGYREHWRTLRWGLFVVGVAFAGILTRFWALAMFSTGH